MHFEVCLCRSVCCGLDVPQSNFDRVRESVWFMLFLLDSIKLESFVRWRWFSGHRAYHLFVVGNANKIRFISLSYIIRSVVVVWHELTSRVILVHGFWLLTYNKRTHTHRHTMRLPTARADVTLTSNVCSQKVAFPQLFRLGDCDICSFLFLFFFCRAWTKNSNSITTVWVQHAARSQCIATKSQKPLDQHAHKLQLRNLLFQKWFQWEIINIPFFECDKWSQESNKRFRNV